MAKCASNDDDRLDRFVAKTVPEPNTGCWLWAASIGDRGYGIAWHDGKAQRAHRVSYRLHIGDIPEGAIVCHRCDVPACVNPEHLFLGTQADNMRDKKDKGRSARGERNGAARLTVADVSRIRALRGVVTQRALANELGVAHWAIGRVMRGETWGQT
jgi:HNH endonuclease